MVVLFMYVLFHIFCLLVCTVVNGLVVLVCIAWLLVCLHLMFVCVHVCYHKNGKKDLCFICIVSQDGHFYGTELSFPLHFHSADTIIPSVFSIFFFFNFLKPQVRTHVWAAGPTPARYPSWPLESIKQY